MIETLYSLTLLLPLIFALIIAIYREFPIKATLLTPITPFILSLLAFNIELPTIKIEWILMGIKFGVDGIDKYFLFFSSYIWFVGTLSALAYLKASKLSKRFFIFFLLSMGGNFGVILAKDLISFYLFYSLMSISIYGIVFYHRNTKSRYFAFIYLIVALFGEMLIVTSFFILSNGSSEISHLAFSGEYREVIYWLLFIGFGIKLGALPFHITLPLIYYSAPTPAGVVLAGTMVNIGVFGWMKFLPLGEIYSTFGENFVLFGIVAIAYGFLFGIFQRHSKAVLAYSSITQMGLITLSIGVGLLQPSMWKMIESAIIIYLLHHSFVKASLFLSDDILKDRKISNHKRVIYLIGTFIAIASISGVIFTSGYIAKSMLYYSMSGIDLSFIFFISPFTTFLLMLRYLELIHQNRQAGRYAYMSSELKVSWFLIIFAIIFFTWIFTKVPIFSIEMLIKSLKPIIIASILTFIAIKIRKYIKFKFTFPAGDILYLYRSIILLIFSILQIISFRVIHIYENYIKKIDIETLIIFKYFKEAREKVNSIESFIVIFVTIFIIIFTI